MTGFDVQARRAGARPRSRPRSSSTDPDVLVEVARGAAPRAAADSARRRRQRARGLRRPPAAPAGRAAPRRRPRAARLLARPRPAAQVPRRPPRPARRDDLGVFDDPDWPILTQPAAARCRRGCSTARAVVDSLLSPGCRVAGTVVRSVLGPGVVVEPGADGARQRRLRGHRGPGRRHRRLVGRSTPELHDRARQHRREPGRREGRPGRRAIVLVGHGSRVESGVTVARAPGWSRARRPSSLARRAVLTCAGHRSPRAPCRSCSWTGRRPGTARHRPPRPARRTAASGSP